VLQPRLRPEHREGDERDDQDHGGRPAEQPLRDRQVGALDEAVREGAGGRDDGERTDRPRGELKLNAAAG
jgi:hypothetical protein